MTHEACVGLCNVGRLLFAFYLTEYIADMGGYFHQMYCLMERITQNGRLSCSLFAEVHHKKLLLIAVTKTLILVSSFLWDVLPGINGCSHLIYFLVECVIGSWWLL